MDFTPLTLNDADVILIAPPFASIDRPSLGLHILKACAEARGFKVRVLYANILFAQQIGEKLYHDICFAPLSYLIGERIFALSAFGQVGSGEALSHRETLRLPTYEPPPISEEQTGLLQDVARSWISELAVQISKCGVPIVGCNVMFEQISSSLAILSAVKKERPATVTLLGGSHCEGQLASGILSLGGGVDFVFSGESERSFPDFLAEISAGNLPQGKIVEGQLCNEMDAIPTTDFADYYQQMKLFFPNSALWESGQIWLPYESSRGCWWGQKHHCTFCGINGQGMTFRAKSPERVIKDLRHLLADHPSNKICMVDNIMPYQFFNTLLPRMSEELPGVHMFYEQKANLKMEQVAALKEAGVALIQPGIESLSTDLLKLMRKGVTGRQNVALLRFARAVDLYVNWNLLYGFPGDSSIMYEEILKLLPLLVHLCPPNSASYLSIDRFSPYYDKAEDFGITNIRPMQPYLEVFPPWADFHSLAYHFEGDYDTAIRRDPSLIDQIERLVVDWRDRWKEEENIPQLRISQIASDLYLLIDTRGLQGSADIRFITKNQAAAALVEQRIETEDTSWAVQNLLSVVLDGTFVPLAVADASLLANLQQSMRCGNPVGIASESTLSHISLS